MNKQTIGIKKDYQLKTKSKDGYHYSLEDIENFNFKVDYNKGHLRITGKHWWINAELKKLCKNVQLQIKRKLKDRFLAENPDVQEELDRAKKAQQGKRSRCNDAKHNRRMMMREHQ